VATVILSDETVKHLLEAHASMAAWYYQMADALRRANAGVEPPSEAQRRAFVVQLGQHFPELGQVAQKLTNPRPYVPPPAMPAPASVMENEGVTVPAPPPDHIATPERIPTAGQRAAPPPSAPPPSTPPDPGAQGSVLPPPPPMIVDPTKVRYE
jgi:hypothetical protein